MIETPQPYLALLLGQMGGFSAESGWIQRNNGLTMTWTPKLLFVGLSFRRALSPGSELAATESASGSRYLNMRKLMIEPVLTGI